MTVWTELEPLLAKVQKPARYIGCEDGVYTPDHHPGAASWLLAYPDTYEIGLPNQGLQILAEIINERPDGAAERTYAPWADLEELMRANGLPLFSVDTHRAAGRMVSGIRSGNQGEGKMLHPDGNPDASGKQRVLRRTDLGRNRGKLGPSHAFAG